MNKEDWAKEALDFLDSMTDDEFCDFLDSCAPQYDAWDIQMYQDAKAGLFDDIITEVKADYKAGKCSPR